MVRVRVGGGEPRREIQSSTQHPAPCTCPTSQKGHGGEHCSNYVAKHLYQSILDHKSFPSKIKHALYSSYLEIDKAFCEKAVAAREYGGSTAVTAVVGEDKVWLANVGDSRAIMSRCGQAVDYTIDHKPDIEAEYDRIRAAGGAVANKRLMGILGVSRSFGDIEYKALKEEAFKGVNFVEDPLTAEPDVHEFAIVKDQDEFIVLASDGLYDVMKSQEVVNILKRNMLETNGNLQLATEKLVQEATERATAMDNITVIVIFFRRS